jgi:hypothetical protein
VQRGTARAVDDVQVMKGILDCRDALAMLRAQLPSHINAFTGAALDSIKAQIDSPLGNKPDMFLLSLILLMGRLAGPWQLIRLATKAAGSDDAKRIAETPYAVAVNIVIDEVDRKVRELSTDLKTGRGVAVSAQRCTMRCAACARSSTLLRSRRGASSSPRCARSSQRH